MLSVQSATQPKLARPELPPLQATRSPSPLASATTTMTNPVPPSPRPAATEGLDHWFEELQKYEVTLNAMAAASEDPKFREELGTIEQWFKLLSESEQTASLYTLLQHANQAQVKFLAAVLNQMSTEIAKPANDPKAKQPSTRTLRPPSLNLPLHSPATPHFNTPAPTEPEKSAADQAPPAQDVPVKNNWANEVSTPLVRMFPKGAENAGAQPVTPAISSPVVGLPGGAPVMNPFNMAMLNQMGYSNEAQLLAVQMIMSGLVQPGALAPHKSIHQPRGSHSKPSNANNWRSPVSAKYPTSALRTGGLKTSGLRSGLRSAGPKSATPLASAGATPKDSDDIDPELLKDIPAWLKSLRLHKYTQCFDGLTWEDMVNLDDATLEAKGVVALGARRRLLKTFDLVKRRMGMEVSTPADTTPASAVLPTINTNLPRVTKDDMVPHSAAPAFAH